jgi:hypothetical protein
MGEEVRTSFPSFFGMSVSSTEGKKTDKDFDAPLLYSFFFSSRSLTLVGKDSLERTVPLGSLLL